MTKSELVKALLTTSFSDVEDYIKANAHDFEVFDSVLETLEKENPQRFNEDVFHCGVSLTEVHPIACEEAEDYDNFVLDFQKKVFNALDEIKRNDPIFYKKICPSSGSVGSVEDFLNTLNDNKWDEIVDWLRNHTSALSEYVHNEDIDRDYILDNTYLADPYNGDFVEVGEIDEDFLRDRTDVLNNMVSIDDIDEDWVRDNTNVFEDVSADWLRDNTSILDDYTYNGDIETEYVKKDEISVDFCIDYLLNNVECSEDMLQIIKKLVNNY